MTTHLNALCCDACRLEHGEDLRPVTPATPLPNDRRLNHSHGCGRYFLPCPPEFTRLHLLPALVRRYLAVAMSCYPEEKVQLYEPFLVQCGRDNITVHKFTPGEDKLAREFSGLSEENMSALLSTEPDFQRKIVLSILLANMKARRLMHVAAASDMDASYFDYWRIELKARPNNPSRKMSPGEERMLISFFDTKGGDIDAAESVLAGTSQQYVHKESDPEALTQWRDECERHVSRAPASTRRIYRQLTALGFTPTGFGEFMDKYVILHLGRLIGRIDEQGRHFATTTTPEGIKIELHFESLGSWQVEEAPEVLTPELVTQ